MASPSTTSQGISDPNPPMINEDQPEELKKDSRFLAKLNRGISKISAPMNKIAMKAGCEPFSPQNLDFEFDKAARILRSFCIHDPSDNLTKKALRKIPPEVIQNCKGIAIFTAMRFGWQMSNASGCGIVLAKLPNGQWSPPAGIHIQTLGTGVMAGVDVYDCVAVINTEAGLEGFTRLRGTIGAGLSAAAGPFGVGQTIDSELHPKRVAPVWTYIKSKGLYLGAQIDTTIAIERTEENPRFYGKPGVRAIQILRGEVEVPPGTESLMRLWETLYAIEGEACCRGVLSQPCGGPREETAQVKFEDLKERQ